MTVSVRPARKSDAASIARLMSQLGYEVSPLDAGARLERISAKPEHRFLVAEFDGSVVGWIHASLSEHLDAETCVLIEGLVVDRRQRRAGIGKQLLTEVEEWARATGCAMVRLRSTDARTEAHKFYEHLGYRKIKTQFSFAKAVDPDRGDVLDRLVPRVEQ
jgi:GNAT superfamily N-acetyltransferase